MNSKYSRFDYFLGFVFMAIIALVFYLLLPERWTGVLKYSRQFDVSFAQVHWKDKPADCDYLGSPLGAKGCHFKISIAAYNSAGEIVGGDDAPLYKDDPSTGKPLVSYDSGSTWHPRGRDTSNTVTRVVVNWTKVDD